MLCGSLSRLATAARSFTALNNAQWAFHPRPLFRGSAAKLLTKDEARRTVNMEKRNCLRN
jgi:hypothetical protein